MEGVIMPNLMVTDLVLQTPNVCDNMQNVLYHSNSGRLGKSLNN